MFINRLWSAFNRYLILASEGIRKLDGTNSKTNYTSETQLGKKVFMKTWCNIMNPSPPLSLSQSYLISL